jgi:hypothetical protein
MFSNGRLYVVSVNRTERDLACRTAARLSDGGSVLPLRDSAWALWAQLGIARARWTLCLLGGASSPGRFMSLTAGRLQPDQHDLVIVSVPKRAPATVAGIEAREPYVGRDGRATPAG